MNAEEIQNPDSQKHNSRDAERRKSLNVTMLDSESLISPPLTEHAKEVHSTGRKFPASDNPGQNSGQIVIGKRTLAFAAGIIVLLCAGIMAVLFFNRQETPIVSQQTKTETSDALPEAQQSSQSQPIVETSKNSEIKTQSNPSGVKNSAPVSVINSSTVQPRNDIASPLIEKPQSSEVDGNTQAELNASLGNWIDATNEKNVERQMTYYAPKVNSFYRARNASINAVRDEKKRVFDAADAVDIQAGKPNITLSRDGRTATMKFRKKYSIKKGQQNRNGEVIQELKWVKSKDGWRIVSERDLKVVN